MDEAGVGWPRARTHTPAPRTHTPGVDPGGVSLTATDCLNGRQTIFPCYLSMAEWSDARSDVRGAYWNTPQDFWKGGSILGLHYSTNKRRGGGPGGGPTLGPMLKSPLGQKGGGSSPLDLPMHTHTHEHTHTPVIVKRDDTAAHTANNILRVQWAWNQMNDLEGNSTENVPLGWKN